MKPVFWLVGLAIVITCLMACQSNDEKLKKIFLIPSTIEGPLRIVFEEKCGIKPEEENGQQTLKFGNNGFLILSGDFNHGKENEFYLVDARGEKTKVNVVENSKDRDSLTPSIVVGAVGVTYLASLDKTKTESTRGIAFQDFYLYNKKTAEGRNETFSTKNDSLTNVAVNECRMNN